MTAVLDALRSIEDAGVRYCVRADEDLLAELQPGDDLDVLVTSNDLDRVDAALAGAGFHRLHARGHPGHRFYLGREGSTWRKLDVLWERRYDDHRLAVDDVLDRRMRVGAVWAMSEEDLAEHRRRRAAGQRPPRGWLQRVARALPSSPRRTGPVIAVLGPDGAGKGTILAEALRRLPVGASVVYLGNAGGRSRPSTPAAPTAAPSPLRETAFLARKALSSWRRLLQAYLAAWRGHVVLTDRHPIEVLATRPERTPLGRRVETLLQARLVPAPDAVVVLDAPAEVLYARKPEHPTTTLERWRAGYRTAFGAQGTFVDTDGPIDEAVEHVLDAAWVALARRRRWPPPNDRS